MPPLSLVEALEEQRERNRTVDGLNDPKADHAAVSDAGARAVARIAADNSGLGPLNPTNVQAWDEERFRRDFIETAQRLVANKPDTGSREVAFEACTRALMNQDPGYPIGENEQAPDSMIFARAKDHNRIFQRCAPLLDSIATRMKVGAQYNMDTFLDPLFSPLWDLARVVGHAVNELRKKTK